MIRLALKLALSAAAVWAIWTFVPVRERTLAERWSAAGNLSRFLDRGFAEVSAAWRGPPQRPQAREKPVAPRERPVEAHPSEEDRQAIERLLARRLAESR
jgi:hypothetical protein